MHGTHFRDQALEGNTVIKEVGTSNAADPLSAMILNLIMWSHW